uniref:Uncharacterized protein n=1 Tax=Avena sativa TaxID=4498 RepID=A0ACD5YDM4_AVESA
MDLNLYLGLPPLPRPPGRLGAAMDCPAPAGSPVPEAPRPGDDPAAGPPPLPPVFSPFNELSTPEIPLIDPILVDWLDGLDTDSDEDTLDAGELAEALGVPSEYGLSTDSEEDTLEAGERAQASDASSDDGLSSESEDTLDASSSHDDYMPLPDLVIPEPEVPSSHDVYMLLPDLVIPEPEVPTVDEPEGLLAEEEMLALPLEDWEPDAPSTTDIWGAHFPMIFAQSDILSTDSEEALDAGEQSVAFDAPSHDANTSPPPPPTQLPLAGLEGVRLEWVERLSHSDRVAPAAAAEMVSTRQSVEGAIEDTTPELRFQRLIQVSEQHRIARPGPVSRSQRATSPEFEAERLLHAIQRSHSSLDASRRQNLDANGKMGGTGAVKKDANCGCNGNFECNICLDAAKEPVVTPCGHLFCWPCLYQWLHGHSVHSECPVCKGEVLEVNVTPIYGRGGGERDASSSDVPPRPSANRSESMRQQLQMPDPRGIESMVRRLIENQDQLSGQAAQPAGGVEVTVFPEGLRRLSRIHRQQRTASLVAPSPIVRPVPRYAARESGSPAQLPSSNSDNAAPSVPQQSSSMEQASTSSTVAVIVGQAAQSRRSRPPSEPTATRRTRRRQQH